MKLNIRRLLAGAAGALFALGCGVAGAQTLSAVGQIVRLHEEAPGDVEVINAAGDVRPAKADELLRHGDQVRTKAEGAVATVYDVGTHRLVRVVKADGPRLIVGEDPGSPGPAAEAYFHGLDFLFQRPIGPVPIAMRNPNWPKVPIVTDPLLPLGTQHLPRGMRGLALIWRDGVGDVTLFKEGKQVSIAASGKYASLTLNTKPLDGDYSLVMGRSALTWRVSTVDPAQVPEPPWMAGKASTTESERVVRAAWLLRQGPADWRLFAISEIADLSDHNFAADRLWQAIQSREFPAPGN